MRTHQAHSHAVIVGFGMKLSDLPQYSLGNADEDDYTGFPKNAMYFARDKPNYEQSFIRCRVKDCEIKIKPGKIHGIRNTLTPLHEIMKGRQPKSLTDKLALLKIPKSCACFRIKLPLNCSANHRTQLDFRRIENSN